MNVFSLQQLIKHSVPKIMLILYFVLTCKDVIVFRLIKEHIVLCQAYEWASWTQVLFKQPHHSISTHWAIDTEMFWTKVCFQFKRWKLLNQNRSCQSNVFLCLPLSSQEIASVWLWLFQTKIQTCKRSKTFSLSRYLPA